MSYTPLVLSVASSSNLETTSFQVEAPGLASPITAGDLIFVVWGLTSQTFLATGNAIGDQTIGVQPQITTGTFPIGSFLVDATTAVPQITPANASPDTLTLYGFLPPFVQDQDESNDYVFLSWLEGIGSQQQVIDNLVRDTPTDVGWSIVLDVNRCPDYALPWLAQFVGLRFSGATLANPAAMRGAIQAPGNWARGTLATILQAAGVPIQIIERSPDAYSFTVKIPGTFAPLTYAQLAAQYPTYPAVAHAFPLYSDFNETSSTANIEAAVIAATPGGLIPNFVLES